MVIIISPLSYSYMSHSHSSLSHHSKKKFLDRDLSFTFKVPKGPYGIYEVKLNQIIIYESECSIFSIIFIN